MVHFNGAFWRLWLHKSSTLPSPAVVVFRNSFPLSLNRACPAPVVSRSRVSRSVRACCQELVDGGRGSEYFQRKVTAAFGAWKSTKVLRLRLKSAWRCFVALSNVSFLGVRTSCSIIKATFTETTWTIFSSPVVSLEQHLYSAKKQMHHVLMNYILNAFLIKCGV